MKFAAISALAFIFCTIFVTKPVASLFNGYGGIKVYKILIIHLVIAILAGAIFA